MRPGNTLPLALTPEQRRAFRDRDGRIGLDVLRHLLGARASSVDLGSSSDAFPLTAHVFQAVGRRLSRVVCLTL